MRHWARLRLIAAVLAAVALSTGKAPAQGMPSPFVQEVLVKSILLTLNDAVTSDNFTVMHAKISKPFRDQFPPLKDGWVFVDDGRGGDMIRRAKLMNVSISCDHRVVDGWDAASFVQALKKLLETPVLLFAD